MSNPTLRSVRAIADRRSGSSSMTKIAESVGMGISPGPCSKNRSKLQANSHVARRSPFAPVHQTEQAAHFAAQRWVTGDPTVTSHGNPDRRVRRRFTVKVAPWFEVVRTRTIKALSDRAEDGFRACQMRQT